MGDNSPASIRDRLKAAINQLFEFKKEKFFSAIDDLQLEKRLSPRKKHFSEVCYADSNRSVNAFIQDISVGGLSIEPDGPFLKGQEITLTFMHPSAHKHVKITGKIVRKDQNGIGVEFSQKIEDI
ncbi:MAG: PilZ domain-containing protein [Pseudomonadota bacterium]